MTDVTNLSAAELHSLAARLGDAYSHEVTKAVQMGRGAWRASDMRAAAEKGDAAARANVDACTAYYGALSEIQRRREYHGPLKPIRRA